MTRLPTVTRTEAVHDRLRADIVAGRIAPGTQLPFSALRQAYGASMGVLREALMRLTAEGLTVNQAQHGFRVFPLTREDLADVTEARCMIESLVLHDAIAHGDMEWEMRVIAAHHRLERTPERDGEDAGNPRAPATEDWMQAHEGFHAALLSGARSRRMRDIAATLRATSDIYRRWSMPAAATPADIAAEHRALMELALGRQADDAADALVRHLSAARDLVIAG